MIEITFTAPCTYNWFSRGWAEAQIEYTGADPVETARQYLRQIPFARLDTVVLNGHVWLGPPLPR